jgi:antitoxin ParD1/3/4
MSTSSICCAKPLLIQEGWLRHQEKTAQPTLAPQTGWSAHESRGSYRDHPVRSIKGGFAAFLLTSRPPLLCQEGSWLGNGCLRHIEPFQFGDQGAGTLDRTGGRVYDALIAAFARQEMTWRSSFPNKRAGLSEIRSYPAYSLAIGECARDHGMTKYANVCHMATMNISMPDEMRRWIEAQIEAGEFANASDYVRDLIRHDQRERDRLRVLLIESEKSGVSRRSISDIARQTKQRLKRA